MIHSSFPPWQGEMSGILGGMDVGDSLLFKGPKGRFTYERGSKKAIGELENLTFLQIIC